MREVLYEDLKGVNQSFFDDYQLKFKQMLESGWYVLGKEVERFEQDFAGYIGTKYCVGVASGLDALILALMALDLPPKSEVILGANAYVACALSVLRADCVPVLVEPDSSGQIDPQKIEEKITPKTCAIMPVHLYGTPCEMEAIEALSKKHSLHIIEDCAQAHGSQYYNKKVGTFSSISAFSFYPTKNLGALGDGGAVLTNDEQHYKKLRALRNYGSHKKYYNDYIGLNSRLDEIQAGFLNIKLPFLDRINAHKKHLASVYETHLDRRIDKLAHHKGRESVNHIFPIFHPKRDLLRSFLKEKGIHTEIHYPVPLYQQEALKHYFEGQVFPVSDMFHATILSLPISYCHTEEDVLRVCKVLNEFIHKEGV